MSKGANEESSRLFNCAYCPRLLLDSGTFLLYRVVVNFYKSQKKRLVASPDVSSSLVLKRFHHEAVRLYCSHLGHCGPRCSGSSTHTGM